MELDTNYPPNLRYIGGGLSTFSVTGQTLIPHSLQPVRFRCFCRECHGPCHGLHGSGTDGPTEVETPLTLWSFTSSNITVQDPTPIRISTEYHRREDKRMTEYFQCPRSPPMVCPFVLWAFVAWRHVSVVPDDFSWRVLSSLGTRSASRRSFTRRVH